MTDATQSLTEKEKEALRLILRGHDAKSSARELDLSVHTINERLRAARRKLEVTSSKEAARMLLEREGGAYENLGYEELGEASASSGGQTGEARGPAPGRRFLVGVIAMITLFAAGLILTSQFAGDARQDPPVEAPSSDAAVIAAAREWLALGDAGDWQASFDAAGESFRAVNTVSGWKNVSEQVRAPLGEVVSREVLTVRYLNAPPHGYEEVTFRSRYANRDEAIIETLTLQHEDGSWKVVGIILD